MPNVKPKVIAYITREKMGERQLLVFAHRDYPAAGLQVPAGTVEFGEPLGDALLREVAEESGLTRLRMVRKIGTFTWPAPERDEIHERHVFQLEVVDAVPDSWTHVANGEGEDGGLVFEFAWHDLTRPADPRGATTLDLAGDQGDYLDTMCLLEEGGHGEQ